MLHRSVTAGMIWSIACYSGNTHAVAKLVVPAVTSRSIDGSSRVGTHTGGGADCSDAKMGAAWEDTVL